MNGFPPILRKFGLWDDESEQHFKEVQLYGARPKQEPAAPPPPTPAGGRGPLQCGVCKVPLEDRAQQKAHYTTPLHRANQQRALKGLQALSLHQMTEGSTTDKADAEESSEDSDSEETPVKGSPRIYLQGGRGEVVSVFRVLAGREQGRGDVSTLAPHCHALPHRVTSLSYVLQSGGSFVAALYRKGELTLHKTFHSYTIRAGQGRQQSSHDSSGKHAKSAGAQLRRYNEQAYHEHVRDTIKAWRQQLLASDVLFLTGRAADKANVLACLGLGKTDPKLRKLPLPVNKSVF